MWKFWKLCKKKEYLRYRISDHEIIEARIVKDTGNCLQISYAGRGFSTNTLWIVKNDKRILDMDGVDKLAHDAENVTQFRPPTRA